MRDRLAHRRLAAGVIVVAVVVPAFLAGTRFLVLAALRAADLVRALFTLDGSAPGWALETAGRGVQANGVPAGALFLVAAVAYRGARKLLRSNED
jgi:hypothetical protein